MTLHAPYPAIELISQAMQTYANAAYPPGGSECAQSAREALLVASDSLIKQFDAATNTSTVSRRLRSHIRAAVEYYFDLMSQQDQYVEFDQTAILSILAGKGS